MSGIVHRAMTSPKVVAHDDCGTETHVDDLPDEPWCWTCETYLPWADVGMIHAIVETEGGERLRIQAERAETGGWYPTRLWPLDGDRAKWRKRRAGWP